MKAKKKTFIIIFSCILAALLITTAIIVMLKRNTEEVIPEDKYPLGIPSMSYFQNYATSVCENGDFIYLSNIWGDTYEYDKKNDKIIEIPKANDGMHFTSLNAVDGNLYAMSSVFMDASKGINVINKSLNTEDYKELFELDETKIAGNISVSENNIFFYVEGDTSLPENAKESYRLSLYMYDLNSNKKTLLTDNMHNYYIQGNRVYFSRYHLGENSMTLHYIDFDDIDNIIDTEIVVCSDVSGYYYMFLPVGNKVYYSNTANTLYCTDLESGKTETVYTGADNEIIYFYNIFNDEMIIQSKVHLDPSKYEISRVNYLYRVNLKTKEKNDIISYEDKSQVQGFLVFDNKKDNDNFLVIRGKPNDPSATNYDYWLYDKNFKGKMFFSDLKAFVESD